MTDFTDKTVLITGAAGGIGQAMVQYFAERGAWVAALDRQENVHQVAETLTAAGKRAVGVVADISKADQVAAAYETIAENLAPVEILINNAGISNADSLEQTTPESWHLDFAVNLGGAYHCARLAIESMKPQGAGAIVNIASVNGLIALGDPGYSAAKAGMINFTKSLAMEYGRYGIRANVICPGTVRTPIWTQRIARNPEILSELVKWYPLGRVADPIDIAKAAAFLASEDAGAITGAVLPVDCGLMAGNIVMARELTLERF